MMMMKGVLVLLRRGKGGKVGRGEGGEREK